jgi:hypothetical protein
MERDAFFDQELRGRTFAAIMHSSMSLCASLRSYAPICSTSPEGASLNCISRLSKSMAPRRWRDFASTW